MQRIDIWYRVWCLECKTPNWIYQGCIFDNQTDDTATLNEGVKCLNCGTHTLIDNDLDMFICSHTEMLSDQEDKDYFDHKIIPERLKTKEGLQKAIEEYADIADGKSQPD